MKETPMIVDLEPGTYYWCKPRRSATVHTRNP